MKDLPQLLKRYVSLIAMALLALHCDESPVGPNGDPPSIRPAQFAITQVDYYEYQVSTVSVIESPSRIDQIQLGTVKDSIYSIQAVVAPTVRESGGKYLVEFTASASFLDTTSREETVRIRLVNTAGSSVDADTILPTYKYPYESNEIVLDASSFNFAHFQDIVFLGNTMFFHPLGGHGLYRYDDNTRSAEEVMPYGGGDHIAADSGFVFIDESHSRIFRWDSDADTVFDMIVNYWPSSGPRSQLLGLDTYNGRLVVLAESEVVGKFLAQYDYRGNLLDSLVVDIPGYYLAIRDGILFTNWWSEDHIIYRHTFDGTALVSLMPPVRLSDGIKFHGDYLYYCDYNRRLVGRVPVGALREIE